MAKFIAINFFTHNHFWTSATIGANTASLAKNGIELVPSPYNWYGFKQNSELWAWTEKEAAQFIGIKNRLASGLDQLAINTVNQLDLHENFIKAVLKSGIPPDKFESFIVIGPPALFYEIPILYTGNLPTPEIVKNICQKLQAYPAIVKLYQQTFPENNIHLLPDLSSRASRETALEITGQIFKSIGAEQPQNMALPQPTSQFFNTATASRLLKIITEVRNNAWPELDNKPLLDSIRRLDEKIAPQPATPPEMRLAFQRDPAMRKLQYRLEKLCGIEEGSFGCPGWFDKAPGLQPDDSLDCEQLRFFVENLPEKARSILLRRFANDKPLLTADQKMLADELAKSQNSGMDFNTLQTSEEQPLLTVLTMTRNHEKYIAQCMDSVLMQKTSFPVRHLVLDHHSDDVTPEIVACYAAKHSSIQPVLLSAHKQLENVLGLFLRCRTKYAALCDGDDYFTDPLKLQKQVDYLESHPRSALCFHITAVLFENGEQPGIIPSVDMLPRGWRYQYYLADLIQGNFIQTNSVVYRWRFQDGLPDWFRPDLCPGDWYWHLLHAEKGSIGFLPEIMSVYRRHGKALYKDSFRDQVNHRRTYGMAELTTYQAINEHFNGRYFKYLAELANGVFDNFLTIYIDEEDNALLDQACDKFPDFAQNYLARLQFNKKEIAVKKLELATSHKN